MENPFSIQPDCWNYLHNAIKIHSMRKRILFPGLMFFLVLAGPLNNQKIARADAGKTLVLYDAASGAIPSSSLMGFTDFPPGTSPLTYIDGATVLDTTQSGKDTFAGWVASQATTPGFPILDSITGIQVNFTLQVEKESHANPNRAGFSVIILDQDAKGIELAFWENEIWAQGDDRTGGLFKHGEHITFPTTAALTDYQVTFVEDTYTLIASGKTLLTGPLRDYSKFDGFPDPYETPNFLFLGDDTTSSQARVRLGFVSVTGTEPVQPTAEITNTSTSIPMPTATLTPLPTSTLVPSLTATPTSRRKPFALCSSGWLILPMMLTAFLINKIKR